MGKNAEPERRKKSESVARERRRMRRQLSQTAAQRYADHRKDIAALLDLVGEEVRAHAERAAKEPESWGYVGDLSRTREALKDLLACFMVGRCGWSETTTLRFIEEHLDEMRSS